ncbi:hypothetical protein GH733_006552 [Mirounga leonina]|nr:hypothetical protein GH733_006552 [Mirounga leonina]
MEQAPFLYYCVPGDSIPGGQPSLELEGMTGISLPERTYNAQSSFSPGLALTGHPTPSASIPGCSPSSALDLTVQTSRHNPLTAPQSILIQTASPNSVLPPDESYFNLHFKKKPFISGKGHFRSHIVENKSRDSARVRWHRDSFPAGSLRQGQQGCWPNSSKIYHNLTITTAATKLINLRFRFIYERKDCLQVSPREEALMDAFRDNHLAHGTLKALIDTYFTTLTMTMLIWITTDLQILNHNIKPICKSFSKISFQERKDSEPERTRNMIKNSEIASGECGTLKSLGISTSEKNGDTQGRPESKEAFLVVLTAVREEKPPVKLHSLISTTCPKGAKPLIYKTGGSQRQPSQNCNCRKEFVKLHLQGEYKLSLDLATGDYGHNEEPPRNQSQVPRKTENKIPGPRIPCPNSPILASRFFADFTHILFPRVARSTVGLSSSFDYDGFTAGYENAPCPEDRHSGAQPVQLFILKGYPKLQLKGLHCPVSSKDASDVTTLLIESIIGETISVPMHPPLSLPKVTTETLSSGNSISLSICKGWIPAGQDLQEWLAEAIASNLRLCDTNGKACETSLAKSDIQLFQNAVHYPRDDREKKKKQASKQASTSHLLLLLLLRIRTPWYNRQRDEKGVSVQPREMQSKPEEVYFASWDMRAFPFQTAAVLSSINKNLRIKEKFCLVSSRRREDIDELYRFSNEPAMLEKSYVSKGEKLESRSFLYLAVFDRLQDPRFWRFYYLPLYHLEHGSFKDIIEERAKEKASKSHRWRSQSCTSNRLSF